MAQDTRKDPRAKVLTMTVRYKSATVDEFIEHHSHDVSRGGMFIKTPSPFLPGTLLKFEIRIADDKAMLQGVGRVVWKRDPPSAGPEKPAGMGVKFIKVDEASRALIDRLVVRGGGTSAYDAELPDGAAAQHPAPAPPPAPMAAAPRVGVSSPPRPEGSRPPAVAPVAGGRKATIMGLGIDSALASVAAGASPSAKTPQPEPMFPVTDSEKEMPPPEERTVMKQAAQLLEEALKGAGGSLDEIGSTPLDQTAPLKTPVVPVRPAHALPTGLPSIASPDDDPTRAIPGPRREAQRKPESAAPPVTPKAQRAAPAPTKSVRPPVVPAASAVPSSSARPAAKKKGGGAILYLGLVAAAAAVAYVAWQDQKPKPGPEITPATAAPPPVTASAPTVSAEPASAPPSAEATASAAPAASAAPPAASAAPTVSAPPVHPLPVPKPPKAEPAVKAEPAPKPEPAPKVEPPPKPEPAPKAETTEPAPKPIATPKPKPKPAPKSDDNPY